MQSTRSASIIPLRISPSPEVLEDIEPLANTNPAVPVGDRWWMKFWTQAKLAEGPKVFTLYVAHKVIWVIAFIEGIIKKHFGGIDRSMLMYF